MAAFFEHLAFFLLVSLAALRPLVAETYDTSADPFTHALQGLTDPSPVRTAAFDVAILVATSLSLLAQAVRPTRRFRWTGLEAGLVLIVIAAVISSIFAGNRRLAINAAVDWLCMPLAAIALAQILKSPWQFRVLLAAVLATAAVQAVQCVEQAATFDDTWAHYQSIREEFWKNQGVELDSGRVDLFEQRIKAGEASGFFSHSNVAGAYLVTCAFAALGVAVGRCGWAARREPPGTPAQRSRGPVGADARSHGPGRTARIGLTAASASLVIVLASAAALTHSLGAALSAAAGLGWAGALWILRRWWRFSRRAVLAVCWATVVVAAIAVVAHGLRYDRLPGSSLTFRWQYWTTSAKLIADHPWTGVGRENFGRHYLQYKPIQAPEEITNPHNVFVQAAAELGIPGLAGVLVMLVGGSLIATGAARRTPDLAAEADERSNSDQGDPNRRWLWWGGGLLLWVTIVRLPLFGSDDPDLVYYATVVTAVAWSLAYLAVGWFVPAHDARRGGKGAGVFDPDPAAAFWVGVGLFTFLLHDTINFAIFVPGAAYSFFVLVGYVVAANGRQVPLPATVGKRWPWLGFCGAAAAMAGGVIVFILIPARGVSSNLASADSAAGAVLHGKLSVQPAWRFYQAAAAADPLDPTPHAARARWLAAAAANPAFAAEAYAEAVNAVEEAMQRDPFNVSLARLRRQIWSRKADWSQSPGDFAEVLRAADAVLSLYPNSPGDVVVLADAQAAAGSLPALPGNERLARLEAGIETYRRALDLDARRPAWERHRRFSPTELEAIRGKLEDALEQRDALIREPGKAAP